MTYLKNRSPEESLEILRAVSKTCLQLGGPLSARVYSLVEAEAYTELSNFTFEYSDWTPVDIIYARQIQALFSKLEFLGSDLDKVNTAVQRFKEAEALCRDTNSRFRIRNSPLNGDVEPILHRVQRKISLILGVCPDLDAFNFAFGPGANTNVNGQRACPRVKLSADLVCSANLTPSVGDFLAEVPEWSRLHASQETEDAWHLSIGVVPGRLAFVPKNMQTYRSIVIEPLLNAFFQKGVGSYLKSRLLHAGCDLYDQTNNQRLARKGSVDGTLSTIDLSMASDCLARNVVASLLPLDWWQLLDSLRTSEVTYRGEPILLEKFSSMGNGYTFELESLIFYAICLSVCDHLGLSASDVSVFGDDLIVPSASYDLLVEVLAYVGFSVNQRKSYKAGPFRESCGADYLNGIDVRPFYQKTLVSDRTLYTMHNWFLRNGERELAAKVESFTNPALRLYGPDGYGDGHLIGSYSLRYPRQVRRAGYGGGYFDTYTLSPKYFRAPMKGDAVLPVYSVYTRSGELDPTDPNVIRGSSGYAKVSIYTLATTVFHGRIA